MARRVAIVLGILFLAWPLAAAAEDGKALRGVALVIGQSKYEHLSPLANPDNDADAIEALLGDLGFDSVRRTDRDASALARDLERFAEDAEDADVAVLYYSGHAIEAGGENFLIPVDADLSSLDDAGGELVPVSALIDKLKSTVPIAIVMLDACRNNPFPPGSQLRLSAGASPVPVGTAGLGQTRGAVSLKATTAQVPQPSTENVGTVIAYAAEPGQVALDGDAGGNSPYAGAVLRHFDAMAGEEFGMVMRMVAEEVYLKTGGRQRPWMNESLRRQLYFGEAPKAAEGEQGEILRERRQLLVTIAALPDRERKTIETVASDTNVPMDALYGMLKALGSEVPDDPAQLDALLRGQTEKVKAMIAERDTLKSSDPEITRLSALADEALAEGALTTAISLRQQAKARAQEVEKTVDDAEEQLRQRRIELADVFGKSAEAYALAFKHREAGHDYEEASRQVERWDDEQAFWYMRSASTAYLDAGKFRGGKADLERASATGERAADMVERLLADHPDDKQYWEDIAAQTLNNWANATNALYAVSNDKAHLMQAIDAFERALKVLSRERVEQDWVVVQHNLAGALMQLGETETDNATLERSVAAYKAALTVWTRDADPMRWALAAANMANAQSAIAKRARDEAGLRASIELLKAVLEVQTPENAQMDWAWTQRELATTYADLALLTKNEADIRGSVEANQQALRVYTLDRAPRAWAQTMHSMAYNYQTVPTSEARGAVLDKADALYEQVLAAIDADDLPAEYALSLGNLGNVRIERGKLNSKDTDIAAGIEDLRRASDLYVKMQRPVDHAGFLSDIGQAFVTLGKMRSSVVEPQQAIEAYEQAIAMYRDAGQQADADSVRSSLAFAQVELGYQRSKIEDYAGAVEAYQASLENRDRDKDTENWLFSANQLAIALQNVGAHEDGVDALRKSAEAYRTALSATSQDGNRDGWTETQENLISALRTIAERSRAVPDQIALADAYGALGSLKERTRDRGGEDKAAADRAWALSLAAEYGNDPKLFEQTASAYRDVLKTAALSKPDHLFAVLNFSRSLFIASNLDGGDAARREAIAVIDDNWPLIDSTGTIDQKVFALIDRANLMATIAVNDPAAIGQDAVDSAFARAADTADPTADPASWQAAQRALATYQLTSVEDPAFPLGRMHSGLGALRKLLDATPKQTEPTAWAELANWYGYALGVVGKRENATASFEEALPLLRDALSAYQTAGDSLAAAHVRDSLCTALVGLGRLTKQRDMLQEGVTNCDNAVATMRTEGAPEVLAIAEANLADARKALAEVGGAAN